MKPFEALKVTLARYIKRRETVAAAATISVTPIFNQEKEEKYQKTQRTRDCAYHF